MKLEVLISAMNQKDMSLAEKIGCNTDVLIINQSDYEAYEEKLLNGNKIRMYTTMQRGLSKSRNMAICHAVGDICLICDDDEVLADNYDNTILDAFSRNPEADIISFNWRDLNPKASKKFIVKEKKSSRFQSFSSISLAFKRERVLSYNVWFDIRFGAGSGMISSGEEAVWQREAARRGLRRFECPDYIATVRQESSTWFTGYNEKYFYDLGASLSVNYPNMKHIFKFYYLFRLHKFVSMSKRLQLQWINSGIKGFASEKSFHVYMNN
ncbi:MAG: glycosyltransferase family 2 protein [Bacteroidales bacterium]|nr:glycosyltransferase family 2 protein [Bacteroidales bacterium]